MKSQKNNLEKYINKSSETRESGEAVTQTTIYMNIYISFTAWRVCPPCVENILVLVSLVIERKERVQHTKL